MPTDLINKKIIRKGNKADKLTYGLVENSTIVTYGGNDVITIDNLSSSIINLGQGGDTVNVTSVSSSNRGTASQIIGNLGRDTVVLGYTFDDILVAYNSGQRSPNSWSVFVFLDIGKTPKILLSDVETIKLSDGKSLSLSKTLTINGTTSADTNQQNEIFSVDSASGAPIIINAGTGDDRIYSDLDCAATINGGVGNDTLALERNYSLSALEVNNKQWRVIGATESGQPPAVNVLNSVEYVEYSGLRYTLFERGAKVEKFPSSDSTNPIKGTSGSDTMIGTSNNDDFYIGRGNDIIDLSAGGADRIFVNFNYLATLVPGDASTSPIVTIQNFKGSVPTLANGKKPLQLDVDKFDWTTFAQGKTITQASNTLTTDAQGYLTGSIKLAWSDTAGSTPLAEATFNFTRV